MTNKFIFVFLTILLMQSVLMSEESDITTIGTIQASSKSLISTQVSGRVEKMLVDVGSVVRKDQPLVQLDQRFYVIELEQKAAALQVAKLEKEDAEKNFQRMKKLWEKPEGEAPSIPLKRFEDAKTKYEQSIALEKQALENFKKAQLNLEETTIKSPYAGIITQKFVDAGESIPTQPVTHVVEIQVLHPLYLEFSLPQASGAQLKLGTPITFEIDGWELDNNSAKIDLFYPQLDEATRSLRCRAILNNADLKIKPGSLAKVRVIIPSNVKEN
jgi:membrane fusion protein, multidrug efflux system